MNLLFTIFCGAVILFSLLVLIGTITSCVKVTRRNKHIQEELQARSRWLAAGAKPTGRPGPGRAAFRIPVRYSKPKTPTDSFFTRMRKVLSK